MNNISKLKEMLLASHFTVAITGAGISNNCGIADMEKMNVLNAIETFLVSFLSFNENMIEYKTELLFVRK